MAFSQSGEEETTDETRCWARHIRDHNSNLRCEQPRRHHCSGDDCANRSEAIFAVLKPYATRLHLVGHEATSWSAWLHRELESRGIPMVLLETHHAARMLEAQRNKTDKNDARGLAQLVRSGWFKPVHAKSDAANRMKLLLAHRRTLKRASCSTSRTKCGSR